MFTEYASKHPHWISACQRFAASHNMAEIAQRAGMNPQLLRNKLNPDQPHELTVAELIAITQAERAPSLPHQAIDLNAKIASIGQRALELTDRGRITRSERNTLVSVATSAMGSLAILIHDIEARFQAVPPWPAHQTS